MKILKRLLLRCLQIGLAFVALTALAVLWRGWVDPGQSAMMVETGRLQAAGGQTSVTLRHRWVDLEDIAPAMQLAVVAAEDQKFPVHHGFDLEAIREAWQANQRGSDLRGASTISMQVAKNLFLWRDRGWLRKGLEAWFTLLIETFWSKQRILEMYLNIAQFDARIFGVEAASQYFYAKPAARLDRYEAALLAAVLPAPEIYRVERPGDYIRERQLWILRQMRGLGYGHLPGREGS